MVATPAAQRSTATPGHWSPLPRGDWRQPRSHRWAIATPGLHALAATEHPAAQKTRQEHAEDELRALFHKPDAGRSTRQGRRTERPASDNAAGPSGQTAEAQAIKRHTNK